MYKYSVNGNYYINNVEHFSFDNFKNIFKNNNENFSLFSNKSYEHMTIDNSNNYPSLSLTKATQTIITPQKIDKPNTYPSSRPIQETIIKPQTIHKINTPYNINVTSEDLPKFIQAIIIQLKDNMLSLNDNDILFLKNIIISYILYIKNIISVFASEKQYTTIINNLEKLEKSLQNNDSSTIIREMIYNLLNNINI